MDSSARSLPHSDIFQLEWVRANAKLSIVVISIPDEGISVVDWVVNTRGNTHYAVDERP